MSAARIPIVVVGTGFGARIQVPGFRASGRFDVVALVGRSAERVKKLALHLNVPHALTSFDEMLALPGIAAVSVATPPDTHAAYATAAARAGKHVMCEKPMVGSVAEAEAMLDALEAAGVVGLIDHEFRFDPARVMLGRLITTGDLGRPRLVTCVAHTGLFIDSSRPAPAWWFDTAAGGGWLRVSGAQMIDTLRVWLGEFAALTALMDAFQPERHVADSMEPVACNADDTFALLFRMANGAQGVMQQTAVAWGQRYIVARIAGSVATAWIDDRGRLWRHAAEKEPREVPIPPELRLPMVALPPESGPLAAWEFPAFVRQAQRFADRIQGIDAAHDPQAATFADGVACQRVVDAAREAARSGRWITMGMQREGGHS